MKGLVALAQNGFRARLLYFQGDPRREEQQHRLGKVRVVQVAPKQAHQNADALPVGIPQRYAHVGVNPHFR